MQNKIYVRFILLSFLLIMSEEISSQVQIGLFADCQFCDCQPSGTRFYSNSLAKLDECIATFNSNKKLHFVVGLGDLIDRNFNSLKSVNQIVKMSDHKVYHVLGNHDFSVDKSEIGYVPGMLNLKSNYYKISKKKWTFIFLNGNEISMQSSNILSLMEADKWIEKLKRENKSNAQTWNGALGCNQLDWLEKQLNESERRKMNVAILCHYPILPFDAHCLWDSDQVLKLIQNYKSVKIWINGHNHAGNYVQSGDIHFLNLKGMVETEKENAFCEIDFYDEKIIVKGYGREPDRIFSVKN